MRNQTLYIDTKDLDRYIANMRKKSYKGMIRDANAIARQSANDIKRAYKPFVPKSDREGATKQYGFTSGNLVRSLKIFRKRQRKTFVVEFSIGFKEHQYGSLKRKKRGTADGYYGAWVNAGVAGRQKGRSKRRSNLSQRFRERARGSVNRVMQQGISQRGLKVLRRRLEKDLLANR